jgi:predicted RNA binding protein YcfA (HicA-like mRNA interferase family)
MPRKIRQLIKDLKAGGWYLDHITGSHRIFKHPKIGRHVAIAGKDNEEREALQRKGRQGSAQ